MDTWMQSTELLRDGCREEEKIRARSESQDATSDWKD